MAFSNNIDADVFVDIFKNRNADTISTLLAPIISRAVIKSIWIILEEMLVWTWNVLRNVGKWPTIAIIMIVISRNLYAVGRAFKLGQRLLHDYGVEDAPQALEPGSGNGAEVGVRIERGDRDNIAGVYMDEILAQKLTHLKINAKSVDSAFE